MGKGSLAVRVALACALITGTVQMLTPAAAEPYLLGVDVSHWQGSIDWTAVAADPQRVSFAVLKATSGQTSSDARYSQNRSGALSHGVLVAAYHFAYPDSTPNDARIEADHFVDTAAIAADRVIPALDIESASLAYWKAVTPAQLVQWMRAWLDRVYERTGVRAMIYTNPSFWLTNAGNSDALAKAGYPLWVAHWGVSSPTVPASNWAGDGWRCWQYSDSGRVAGIATKVDMDRLDPSAFVTAAKRAAS